MPFTSDDETNLSLLKGSQRPIAYANPSTGEGIELLTFGPMEIRILEDGKNTDNRLGILQVTVAPHSSGPPIHWHEMHDETFLVQEGTMRFHTADSYIDVPSGGW